MSTPLGNDGLSKPYYNEQFSSNLKPERLHLSMKPKHSSMTPSLQEMCEPFKFMQSEMRKCLVSSANVRYNGQSLACRIRRIVPVQPHVYTVRKQCSPSAHRCFQCLEGLIIIKTAQLNGHTEYIF